MCWVRTNISAARSPRALSDFVEQNLQITLRSCLAASPAQDMDVGAIRNAYASEYAKAVKKCADIVITTSRKRTFDLTSQRDVDASTEKRASFNSVSFRATRFAEADTRLPASLYSLF